MNKGYILLAPRPAGEPRATSIQMVFKERAITPADEIQSEIGHAAKSQNAPNRVMQSCRKDTAEATSAAIVRELGREPNVASYRFRCFGICRSHNSAAILHLIYLSSFGAALYPTLCLLYGATITSSLCNSSNYLISNIIVFNLRYLLP
jgi:hypothetical protein